MKHATAKDGPHVLIVVLHHAQGKISVEFCGKTVADVARGHKLAVTTEEGAVVDSECHRHGRLVDGYAWQRLRIGRRCHRVADFKAFDTDKGTDIAVVDLSHLLAAHAFKGVQFLYFLAGCRAVASAKQYFLPFA